MYVNIALKFRRAHPIERNLQDIIRLICIKKAVALHTVLREFHVI